MNKIPVGISSCLLGQEVRFDGKHTKNIYITEILNRYFEWVSFCPEVASGMETPRLPIQIRLINKSICCVGVENHNRDVTKQLKTSAAEQNNWLDGLCGYILKSSSPSCGMKKVKVFNNEYSERIGTGLFAQHIKEHFPLLPLEEESRLCDPKIQKNFIQRASIMYRWKELNIQPITLHKLSIFYSQHQVIINSCDNNSAFELKNLVANANTENLESVAQSLVLGLMQCLETT